MRIGLYERSEWLFRIVARGHKSLDFGAWVGVGASNHASATFSLHESVPQSGFVAMTIGDDARALIPLPRHRREKAYVPKPREPAIHHKQELRNVFVARKCPGDLFCSFAMVL